jgi:DNA-binding NtrC family response regulator
LDIDRSFHNFLIFERKIMGEKVTSKQSKNINMMIIDEDPNFAKIIKDMFASEYRIELFSSAKPALELLSKGYKPAIILCSDNLSEIKMPEFIENS